MCPRHVSLCLALLVLQAACLASAAGRGLQGTGTAASPSPPLELATLPSVFLPENETVLDSQPAGTVEMKIISGDPAPVAQYGFMVALLQDERFFCGGTLLDATTVLTAAHCVVDTGLVNKPEDLIIWRVDGSTALVAQIFAHPGYSSSTIPSDNEDLTFEGDLHDLAVLKLAGPVPNPVVISLPNASEQVQLGEKLAVAGWGTTESRQASSILMYADVVYLPSYQCPADYTDVLCAGGTSENTCNGDSGGPLITQDPVTGVATQLGITSHGPDCLAGPTNAYGYYTDVRKYIPVIEAFRNGTQIAWSASSGTNGSGSSTNTNSGNTVGSGIDAVTAQQKGSPTEQTDGTESTGGMLSDWGFVEGSNPAAR